MCKSITNIGKLFRSDCHRQNSREKVRLIGGNNKLLSSIILLLFHFFILHHLTNQLTHLEFAPEETET